MPNGTTSQVQFRYNRPIDGIYRVGPAGSNMYFTSIQDAIDAAVLDGHTDANNPATVEIYPGTYTEDLTLSAGINLKGMITDRTASEVLIVGTLSLTLSSGVLAQNIVNLYRLAVVPPDGQSAVIFAGSNTGRFYARECFFATSSTGAGAWCIQSTNSGGGATFRMTDTVVQNNNSADSGAITASGSAAVEFYGGNGGLSNASGGVLPVGISVAGSASFNGRMPSMATGAYTQIFTLASATSSINLEKTTVQNTFAGGHIFNATATGNIRCRHCGLFTANLAGKICNASAAVNLLIHACDFSGSQSNPNAQIDTIVNSFGPGTYNLEQDQIYKEFQVGRGIGYQTIQAAITAAAATGAGNRKVVKIPPGFYTENLTLAEDVDLACDSLDTVSNESGPVTINGVHSVAFVAGGSVVCKGIKFSSFAATATSMFTVSGAGSGNLRFEGCVLNKFFAGVTKLVEVTNFGGVAAIFQDCSLILQGDDGSAMFDYSASSGPCSLVVDGNQAPTSATTSTISVAPNTPNTMVQLLVTPAGGMIADFEQASISIDSIEAVEINSAADFVRFDHCQISQTVIEGTFFRFNASCFNTYLEESTLRQESGAAPNGLPSLAADAGTQASGSIQIATNPGDGDFVTINGTVFTARVAPAAANEFQIGATESDTAENLRIAVNKCIDIGNDSSSGVLGLIYGVSAGDTVTLFAFGDSAGNSYTIDSSVPLLMIPSGANFSGGIDGSGGTVQLGVNSLYGLAGNDVTQSPGGGVIASPVVGRQLGSQTINQPTRDSIVIQNEGVDVDDGSNLPACSWLNFTGDGISAAVQLGNNRKVNVTVPGAALAGEFIVGTGKGQYTTIQDALDAADAFVYGGKKVVLVSPGSYTEDLVLKPNVDLVARSYDDVSFNGAQVTITGIHSFTPAVGGSILVKGIIFSLTSGSFEIAAAAGTGVIEFHGCQLNKAVNEATPMFLCSNTLGDTFAFFNCAIAHQTDSGATFDMATNTNLRWHGGYSSPNVYDITLTPSTLSVSNANLAVLAGTSRMYMFDAIIGAVCQRAFDFSAGYSMIQKCWILQSPSDGEMVKFQSANQQFRIYHSEINVGQGAGFSNLIARNGGDQASGTITVDTNPTGGAPASGTITVDTNPAPGDTATVNGVALTAVAGAPVGAQFQIGGTTDDTATNLAQAIELNVGVVTASAATNVVTITARASGTAGNAITLATSVPAVLLLSGATLSGGTDGDTVTINGTVFMAVTGTPYVTNNEFQVGGTTDITAANLASAINNSASVSIFKVVFGRDSTNVVTIKARKSGTAGNSITLASSVPLVLIPSGANLTGGTDGGANNQFIYDNLGFEQINEMENSLTVIQNSETVTTV